MTFNDWINQTFYFFDDKILRLTYEMELKFPWLVDVAEFFSAIVVAFVIPCIICAILCIFRKTRKKAIFLGIALLIQAILVNFVIKYTFVRDRMYFDELSPYYEMWKNAGAHYLSSFSFPSGHTSFAATFGIGLFVCFNKKFSWLFLFIPVLVGWSRIALFAHYPSDVVFSILVSIPIVILSYYLTNCLFKIKFLNKFIEGDSLF